MKSGYNAEFSDIATYYTYPDIFAILPCSIYTSRIEMSAGFTPEILDACAIDNGLTSFNLLFRFCSNTRNRIVINLIRNFFIFHFL